ncbi:hypothetical protein OHA79_08185 [Streptomyces sp. NBC_00841]|uniref:hypothetical protein n=1 Tax=unclassified Streptomyces TaxID=2593676 RepID=UPI0022594D78|nr:MULTISPECIES: hypothetical protein [unclassified Streptomyces]MCX4536917.1 hypothetical protein [Streptomyces sp. NBC_01669]WRZ97831.1 hypothetical protein OHA79_08185 [Streptomyces sp. NBC_00841]
MSQGPPGARSESTERLRIRQAVALHDATASERTASGPVFVSQPAPAEPAPRPAAAEPAPTRLTRRANRRSRSTAEARPAPPTATPVAPASPATAERADDDGSAPTGTAAAAPTAAPPRAAANSSTPPARQSAGGSGGQGGRPLMAAAAIAGAVLVSVPLVVNQRSNAEQATRAVGDIPASAPVATLGERGGATWPSVQGGTGKEFPEPAERLQQPPGVLPSKTAPGLPDPVDTSGYQPPLIRPTDEKATGKDRAKDRKADDARPDRPLGAIPRPVWSNHVDSSNRPDTTTLDSGRTPRTVLAASDTTADPKPRPAVRRTARSDSGTRTATPRAAAPRVKAAAPAPAPAPASASAPKKKTTAVRATPTAKEGQTKVLHGTYVIGRGQSVATNRISLTMQQNGSLVILDSNGRARWSSGTSGRGDRAVFQGDGNLVVLAADGTAVWSSRTDGNPGAELVLQNDGNVTIQAAGGRFLWGSGTQY